MDHEKIDRAMNAATAGIELAITSADLDDAERRAFLDRLEEWVVNEQGFGKAVTASGG